MIRLLSSVVLIVILGCNSSRERSHPITEKIGENAAKKVEKFLIPVCPHCGTRECVQGPGIPCSIAAGFGRDEVREMNKDYPDQKKLEESLSRFPDPKEFKKCQELIERVPSVKLEEAKKFLSRNNWDVDKAIRDLVRTNMEK